MSPTDDSHILTLILDRLSHIETRMASGEQAASDSRRRMHEKQEEQSIMLVRIDGRVTIVEKAFETAGPALKEWVEAKQKVQGAGMLGRALWRVGAWALSAAVALYLAKDHIVAFFNSLGAKP